MSKWDKVLGTLVESCAYMEPIAYMYYAAAKRQAGDWAWTEKDEADEPQFLRLIERLPAQRDALA